MASSSMSSELSRKTGIFGLKLWAVIGICVALVIVATLFFLWMCLLAKRRPKQEKLPLHQVSDSSKEIKEVKIDRVGNTYLPPPDPVLLTISENSGEKDSMEKGVVHVGDTKSSSFKNPIMWKGDREKTGFADEVVMQTHDSAIDKHEKPSSLKFEANNYERGSFLSLSGGSGSTRSLDSPVSAAPEVSHLGWGHWYTLRELEAATDNFADSNVLGEGGYGIVYRGQLPDSTLIAVKNLLNNRYLYVTPNFPHQP
jgi:hypothetical protein